MASDAEAEPAFRGDSPEQLARWIQGQLGAGLPSPVAACLDFEGVHRDGFLQEIHDLVWSTLRPHIDDGVEETQTFRAENIGEIVSRLVKRRPIIVARNISQFSEERDQKTIRLQTIDYFKRLTRQADEGLKKKNLRSEDVFWVAALAAGNPVAAGSDNLPVIGQDRFQRWHVVEFYKSGDGFVLEQTPRRVSLGNSLRAWASRP